MKNRNYCVTFWQKPTTPDCVKYAVYGEEVCPDTGRVHWQSYIELNKPMRLQALKEAFNDNTMHIERRQGTRDEARAYCMKDGKYNEVGVWAGQGYRSDLVDVVDLMKDGTKLTDIMLSYPSLYCRYRNGLNSIHAELCKRAVPVWRNLHTTLILGPTDIGKTRRAFELYPDAYKIEGYNIKWWQDYDGEDSIIIDEYDNDIPITYLLNILDGYRLRLNVKGSHTYANWTKVVITTNLKLSQLHSNAKPAHRSALMRRITIIEDKWDEVLQGNTINL